ncbi:oligosaccharide flippase family protein [Sphingobacterium faecium]|uniref:oligosaccharide flippase family protein n=1 Tax=Sphingobacterium faecium TaxID=34087 RepID=UPI003207D084
MANITGTKSYLSILKSTSLFAGIQVLQILVTLIRGKLIAVIMGPIGMGLYSISLSLINFLVQISSLGLNYSSVKAISAVSYDDSSVIANLLGILKKWLILTSILGILLFFLTTEYFIELFYQKDKLPNNLYYLSLAIVFNILNNGVLSILQGIQQLKKLAIANFFGLSISIIITIPVYLIFNESGIILGFLISNTVNFIASYYFFSKLKLPIESISFKKAISEGKDLVSLGITMSIATFCGTICIFLSNSFITKYGSISDVGLYNSAISITTQYVGVIFTAMSMDYFPRLSKAFSDNESVSHIVNQQMEIVIMICAPLLMSLLLTAPFLIKLLLSSDFLVIINLVKLLTLSIFFKAAAFAFGYISFAKGDKRVFLFFEGILNSSLMLLGNVIGYHYYGLMGIGYASLMINVLYLFNILLISRYRYKVSISFSNIKYFGILICFLTIVYFLTNGDSSISSYILGVLILLVCTIHSFYILFKKSVQKI